MFQRILVALDGSELAQVVLPQVEALAEKFSSSIVLVQVTSSVESVLATTAPPTTTGSAAVIDPTTVVEGEQRAARDYLDSVSSRMRERGLQVEARMPQGSTVEAILDEARAMNADLIAMTSHGRSGLGRMIFGSVAEGVLRQATCPLLLVRVDG